MPSISAVLRGTGQSRTGPWHADHHRERGHHVHAACLAVDLGGDPVLAECWRGYLRGWVAFIAAMRPRWRELEQPRYHRKLWYAGTPDREGRLGSGDRAVVEIKAGVPDGFHALQTAAQALLFDDTMRGYRRLVVYLAADGGFKVREHTDPGDYGRWLQALREYHGAP